MLKHKQLITWVFSNSLDGNFFAHASQVEYHFPPYPCNVGVGFIGIIYQW